MKYLLFGLLVLLALTTGCDNSSPHTDAVRPVLYIRIQAPPHKILGSFSGTIEPRHESVLAFRTGGRITKRLVNVGDKVKKGDLLASLDPVDLGNQLTSAQGNLAAMEAQWHNAHDEERRFQSLLDQGVGAQAWLDQARTTRRVAQASRDQARSTARLARDQLAYGNLHAEFNGVIDHWLAEAGEVIQAGQPVVQLARPEVKEAVFDLPDNLLPQLSQVQTFHVVSQLEPVTETLGKIRELAPRSDNATRTRQIRLSLLQTPTNFHLGTPVNVTLVGRGSGIIRIPATALSYENSRTWVWVVDPSSYRVKKRTVTTEVVTEGQASVTEGLQDGDLVVTAGAGLLVPGQAVRLNEGEPL